MMKKSIYIIATLLLLAGCAKEPNGGENPMIDPTKVAAVALQSISVEQGETPTRAGETIVPLPVGQQFRLYAFARGVTDINKLITTRTYTIQTSDGAPVMDPDQELLYLPVGSVDIYVVGPLRADVNVGQVDEQGNPLLPQVVDVATDYGVFPHVGVDLIAAKTELTVVAKTDNKFTSNPLRHKMAKVEVVVQRPADASYQNLKVTVIQVKNQNLRGEFNFGVDGGTITPADEGDATILPSIIEDEAGKTYRTSNLLIPRKDVYMKVGVFFICNISETEQVSRRMESGTLKHPLVAGQNNRFVTRPNISQDILFRYRLLPWDEVIMPEDDIHPNESLLFSYNGADAPVERDGKRYWIDRSGNGRDAELVGNVKYNATEKYYYTADGTGYIRVPDLGYVPVYTFEMMATSKFAAKGTAVRFFHTDNDVHENNLSLEVLIPTADKNGIGVKNFLTNQATYANLQPNDKGYLEGMATWAITKNASSMYVMRNGIAHGTPLNISGQATPGNFTNNKLLSWTEKSSGNYWNSEKVRLYSARMSAGSLSAEALKQNHRNDMMELKKVDLNNGYVQDGLILDLQGDKAPNSSLVSGKSVWQDQSGMNNHAEIIGSVHNASDKSYSLTSTAYLRMIASLGTNQSYTVEAVVKCINTSSYQTLLHFNLNDSGSGRDLVIHYPYNGRMYVSSPYGNGGSTMNRIDTSIGSFPYSANTPHQLSISRTENKNPGLQIRSGGLLVHQGANTISPLNEMKFCYIGRFAHGSEPLLNGFIYALRFYNRVLSDDERQINYQLDKVKYNLHP